MAAETFCEEEIPAQVLADLLGPSGSEDTGHYPFHLWISGKILEDLTDALAISSGSLRVEMTSQSLLPSVSAIFQPSTG